MVSRTLVSKISATFGNAVILALAIFLNVSWYQTFCSVGALLSIPVKPYLFHVETALEAVTIVPSTILFFFNCWIWSLCTASGCLLALIPYGVAYSDLASKMTSRQVFRYWSFCVMMGIFPSLNVLAVRYQYKREMKPRFRY